MTKEQEEKDKFENIAKELECDTSDEALDEALDNLDLKIEKEDKTESEKD